MQALVKVMEMYCRIDSVVRVDTMNDSMNIMAQKAMMLSKHQAMVSI